MKKCFIITAYFDGDLSRFLSQLMQNEHSAFIICADGGYELALSCGIVPNLVIGDADSGSMTSDAATVQQADILKSLNKTEFIRIKREKDESDTFVAVQHAVNSGFESIDIIGGIGGRLDHTISNIQTLAHFSSHTKQITMADDANFITIVENSSITLLKKENFFISLFSFSDICSGVTTTGLYYPLENATLRNAYPLGLSNEFTDAEATIKVEHGKLLVLMSKK